MEDAQKYRVVAWWNSEQTGLAISSSAPNAIHFAAPPCHMVVADPEPAAIPARYAKVRR